MFIVVSNRGPRSGDNKGKSAAQLVTDGDFLVRSTGGLVVPGTNAAAVGDYEGFATETVTVADNRTDVHILYVNGSDLVLADTTNNSAAADNNQRMILTDSQTVNNTGTDDAAGVVEQVGVVGPAADKKILCRVIF